MTRSESHWRQGRKPAEPTPKSSGIPEPKNRKVGGSTPPLATTIPHESRSLSRSSAGHFHEFSHSSSPPWTSGRGPETTVDADSIRRLCGNCRQRRGDDHVSPSVDPPKMWMASRRRDATRGSTRCSGYRFPCHCTSRLKNL